MRSQNGAELCHRPEVPLSRFYGPLGLKSDQMLGSIATPKLTPTVWEATVGTVVKGSGLAADEGQLDRLEQATKPCASLLVAPHTPRAMILNPGLGSSTGPKTAVPSEVMDDPPMMLGISQ